MTHHAWRLRLTPRASPLAVARSAKPEAAAAAADAKSDTKSAPDAGTGTAGAGDAKDTATAAAEEDKYPSNSPVAGVYVTPPAAAAAAAAAMAAAIAAASDGADDGNAPLSALTSPAPSDKRPNPASTTRIDPGFAAFIQTYDPKL